LSSLFGGHGHTTEEKAAEDVEPKSFLDKPLEPVPEVPVKPRTGLFGGGWRDHDDDDIKEESESISQIPSEVVPPTLIVSSPETVAPSSQPEPQVEDTVVKTDDSDKVLKLDLDEELSHADVDDFADEESDEHEKSDVEVTNDTLDSKKSDETNL
jgi:hypothetical protein